MANVSIAVKFTTFSGGNGPAACLSSLSKLAMNYLSVRHIFDLDGTSYQQY